MDFSNRIESAATSNGDETEYLYKEIILDLQNLKFEDKKWHLLSEAYNNLGHFLYKHVNFDDAVECYTKAIECNEKFAIPFYNRGTIYYRLGDFSLALKDMQKAVELDPTNAEFLIALEDIKKVTL